MNRRHDDEEHSKEFLVFAGVLLLVLVVIPIVGDLLFNFLLSL